MSDPIVTDESGKQEEEVQVAISPRDAAMQAISAKVDRNELPEGEFEESEVDIQGEERPGKDGDDVLPGQGEQDLVTVKIDGQEKTVPREQIIEAGVRTYQKESAADKRLRQAAEREAELREREERLQQMEADLLNKRNQQEDLEIDEDSQEFADAIFTDEEKVAKHVAKIKKEVREVREKLSNIDREKESEVRREQERAVSHYHSSYQDIARDQDMHHALNRRLKTVAAENPDYSTIQVIDEAAKQVYERFGVKHEDPPPPPPSKQEIKEKMAKQPRTASARKAPPPEKKPPTRTDTLKEMKEMRGVRSY